MVFFGPEAVSDLLLTQRQEIPLGIKVACHREQGESLFVDLVVLSKFISHRERKVNTLP
jgi:hypothetical protein